MSDQISIAMDPASMAPPIQNKYIAIKDDSPAHKAAKKRQSKKRQAKKRRATLLWCVCAIAVLVIITAYTKAGNASVAQSQRVAVQLAPTISDDQLEAVEWAVRSMFLIGSWRYDSRKVNGDMIHLYIQIPVQLAMETDLQRQYIRSSLCPKRDDRVWGFVQPRQLKFHLFSGHKTDNVGGTCG